MTQASRWVFPYRNKRKPETPGDAIAWVVRLGSDQLTDADRRAFQDWLDADPVHRAEYEEARACWFGVAALGDQAETRAALDRPAAGPRVSRRALVAGAAGLAAASVGAVTLHSVMSEQRFSTGVGEQRRIRFPDGSNVILDSNTRLTADFGENERRLRLLSGQARFEVATDSERPFRVLAGADEVRALGTVFDVRKDDEVVKVTLEEGQVAIYRNGSREPFRPRAAAGRSPDLVIRPGRQVQLTPAVAPVVRDVDLERTGAWRYGRIVLDNDSLAYAVAEINRYDGSTIILGDPGLEQVRISGVFQTGRPEAFVDAVTSTFPIAVARRTEKTVVLVARE